MTLGCRGLMGRSVILTVLQSVSGDLDVEMQHVCLLSLALH